MTRTAFWIGIGIVIATLCNGGVTFLKRVGWLERDAFARYMDAYCSDPTPAQRRFWTDCACAEVQVEPTENTLPERDYVFRTGGLEAASKLVKDALFALVVGGALVAFALRRVTAPLARAWLPLAPLAVSVASGLAMTLFASEPLLALVGLRGFAYVALAATCGWLARDLETIAVAVAVLLIVEMGLVGVEFAAGMPLRACPHSFRALGTLVMPNTLGAFCIAAQAFCVVFGPDGWRWRSLPVQPILAALTALLLFASGSATGFIALFALCVTLVHGRLSAPRRSAFVVGSLAVGAMILILLPMITQRPDLFDSVGAAGGRFEKLQTIVGLNSPIEQVFGHGLGFGSNAAESLALKSSQPASSAIPADLDSTVTALLAELGVVGLVSFYGLLVWAAASDARARPAYVVLVLLSLTTNIGEVFPVNFLLGLCLAHTLQTRRR